MLRLKELRLRFGRTQSDVANAIHMSRSNYCNIENGKHDASTEIIRVIAAYYGISTDEIYGYSQSSDIDDHETTLSCIYRSLNATGKQLLIDYAEMLVSKPAYREEESAESAM